MTIDYSIVICTYNPDVRLLQRCLDAVAALDLQNLAIEVIIVDNNSAAPVAELPCVIDFDKGLFDTIVLNVAQQGVGHARNAAIEKSRGKFIVYFDYDNEPERDYLQQLKQLNESLPQIAAWGPGNVSVDFIDGIDPVIEHYGRIAFQERHDASLDYGNQREWQSFYPFGTGLCTASFLLREYVQLAKSGRYTMPGRKGAQLSGGEDTQMVLHCISKGYGAGVAPGLKLKHMIPANRANLNYLKRFAYHTGLDYMGCLVQVFPEHYEKVKQLALPSAKFSRKAVKQFLKAKWAASDIKLLAAINFIGFNEGVYRALQKPVPGIVSSIIKRLRLN